MLDKNKAREIAYQYASEIQKILSPQAVILFGSYVNGSPHEHSDIDIAVVVRDFKGDWLETWAQLFELREHISFDIEPHMMDEADDKSGFLEHVKKTGEAIFVAA